MLTESSFEITLQDLEFIATLPDTNWTDFEFVTDGIPEDKIFDYAGQGLIVCDAREPMLVELRRRDDLIRSVSWDRTAQQAHFMTKWSDQFLEEGRRKLQEREIPSSFAKYEKRFGAAPPAIHEPTSSLATVALPVLHRRERLFQLLKARRTTRAYNRRDLLPLDHFSTVLRYCFGIHGYRRMSNTLTLLKKTSPSGGALHSVDVYPMVFRVDGLESGIYHYNAAQHALELISRVPRSETQTVALKAVAGQQGFSGAHVIFVLVARFGRLFWKYRQHKKAYKVATMDAAHLSQTLYLVCAQLDLGAFVTAAINDKYIESLIGLDGVNDGVIAVCGTGLPRANDPENFNYEPFVPRKTRLTD